MEHKKRVKRWVVIFQRHGATNKQAEGEKDMDRTLTEVGIGQAKALGTKLNGRHIDLVISSPAGRALNTARITAREAMPEVKKLVYERPFRERVVQIRTEVDFSRSFACVDLGGAPVLRHVRLGLDLDRDFPVR